MEEWPCVQKTTVAPQAAAAALPLGAGARMRRIALAASSMLLALSAVADAAPPEDLRIPIPPDQSLLPFAPGGHSIDCDGCGDCAGCDACPGCGGAGRGTADVSCGFEPTCGVDGFACGAPACDTCRPAGLQGAPAYGGAAGLECVPLMLPVLRVDWCRFEFFGGVQGFTGPANFASASGDAADATGAGSFGFHQGVNEGRTLRPWLGVDWAAQLGLRATQNNLSEAPFTSDQRNQLFVTGGFFRRVDYGVQAGVVFDYLNDDWYYHSELTQVRGELSWQTGRGHAWGYRFMAGIDDAVSGTAIRDAAGAITAGTMELTATDQHRLFYRRELGDEGAVDVFAGLTGEDDGLLGLQIDTPLRGSLGLRSGVTYLIPEQGGASLGHQQESWNISMAIVWRPCGPTDRCSKYYKPLFDVADNGTFLVDRL